jgi:hypothetical protein
MLKDRNEAYELLKALGAPDRLIHHAELVSEASDRILMALRSLGVTCDAGLVELGAVLHDAGKIVHRQELSEPGSSHEDAGEILLLSHGVQPEVAQCCSSHGSWNSTDVRFEDRIVALADKLWKGKREAALELAVIDEAAARLGLSRWDVFTQLDSKFEDIAADGPERLQRTVPH